MDSLLNSEEHQKQHFLAKVGAALGLRLTGMQHISEPRDDVIKAAS
jgi:hypothetical protein